MDFPQLSTHPSVCPFIQLSFHPSIRPLISLSIYLSIHFSIYPSIHPVIHFSVCSSIHPSFHSSVHLSVHPSIHPYVHLTVHPSIYLLISYQPPAIHPSIIQNSLSVMKTDTLLMWLISLNNCERVNHCWDSLEFLNSLCVCYTAADVPQKLLIK